MWRVAGPFEYLAITGGSIKDVKLAKKAWIWPTQKCLKFHVSLVNYTFKFLPFFLHAVFTIGPRVTDHESLLLYAKLCTSHVKPSVRIEDLVKGIIEGQTCVFDASKTAECILKEFLGEVLEKVQLELNQFGLVIYNSILVDAAKQNAVKIDLEINAKIKRKVWTGQTKQNAVKTDLETWSQSSALTKFKYLAELINQEKLRAHLQATIDGAIVGGRGIW